MLEEGEEEIEFLDEDADIVQQCIQLSQSPEKIYSEGLEFKNKLLRNASQSKRKVYSDDDDYNPSEEQQHKRRRRGIEQNLSISKPVKVETPMKTVQVPARAISDVPIETRKQMDIVIPDYEDPLCLPVKMVKTCNNDIKRLRSWNDLCLEHMRKSELLKPKSGETVASKRTTVLRHVEHNVSGKVELSIWSKTTAENEQGDINSEVFQCILPKFRETNVLQYDIGRLYKKNKFQTNSPNKNTVLMTKEEHKDGEVLVIYNPSKSLSTVYKRENSNAVETVCSRVCAPCYQTSWRPARGNKKAEDVSCAICNRSFISVYNYLAHLRTHSAEDVRAKKKSISAALSKVVDYHYSCRICQLKFDGIKQLREHVQTHNINPNYTCEVCNQTCGVK